VTPVSEGVRLAVVGWVTSWVRDPAQRDILFDLDAAVDAALASGAAEETLLRLTRSRANLLRMWAG
jgi:PKHD-type hydroxylase